MTVLDLSYWAGFFLVVICRLPKAVTSRCRTQALGLAGLSGRGFQALEHRLNNCGAWDLMLRSMRDLPGQGIVPMSPALAGGFFTTEPPGSFLRMKALLILHVCKYTSDWGLPWQLRW